MAGPPAFWAGLRPRTMFPRNCAHYIRAMLLIISMTHLPATDLGFLLHKNPSRPQRFDLPFAPARAVHPRAGEER